MLHGRRDWAIEPAQPQWEPQDLKRNLIPIPFSFFEDSNKLCWSWKIRRRGESEEPNSSYERRNRHCSEVHRHCSEVHQPGIEPGSVPWQGTILPLDHWC
ncbi:hypothetical protein V6N13_129693 [Hibiscus sabdariffa]